MEGTASPSHLRYKFSLFPCGNFDGFLGLDTKDAPINSASGSLRQQCHAEHSAQASSLIQFNPTS